MMREATSAVASAGAALAGTAETLFDAAADRATPTSRRRFASSTRHGDGDERLRLRRQRGLRRAEAHVGAIVTATTTATTARSARTSMTMKNVDATWRR